MDDILIACQALLTWFPKDGKRLERPRKSRSDTVREDLQNIHMTWTDMERLLMIGHCGKAVSPNVFPEHVKGLRSKVRSITLIYI